MLRSTEERTVYEAERAIRNLAADGGGEVMDFFDDFRVGKDAPPLFADAAASAGGGGCWQPGQDLGRQFLRQPFVELPSFTVAGGHLWRDRDDQIVCLDLRSAAAVLFI
ncbi:unnamed protein product [Linum trigynum]|uniref:Uncharacterized protein n=1 Tax=Linum trigynum TaxID=586398 RepID=A0AAV2GGY6_9ROSI